MKNKPKTHKNYQNNPILWYLLKCIVKHQLSTLIGTINHEIATKQTIQSIGIKFTYSICTCTYIYILGTIQNVQEVWTGPIILVPN